MDKFKEFRDLKIGDNVFIVYEDENHVHHILKQVVKTFEHADCRIKISTEKFIFELWWETDSAKSAKHVNLGNRCSYYNGWLMTTEELAKDRVHSDCQCRAHRISQEIEELTKEMESLLNEEIIYDKEY